VPVRCIFTRCVLAQAPWPEGHEARPAGRVLDDGLHADEVKASPWSPRPEEHLSELLASRSTSFQVSGNGSADVWWKGHALVPVALAAHEYLAVVPVDIVEGERRHFARPEPEPAAQQYERVVPPPGRSPPVTAREQTGDLALAERRGPLRGALPGELGNGRRHSAGDNPSTCRNRRNDEVDKTPERAVLAVASRHVWTT